MSKFKFIKIIDSMFVAITLFLIIFAILQYFLKSIAMSSLISAFITFSSLFLIKVYKNSRAEKNISPPSKEELETFFINFLLLSNNEKLSLIQVLFKCGKDFKINKQKIEFYEENKKACVIINKSLYELNNLEIINLIQKNKKIYDKLILISNNFSSNYKNIKLDFFGTEIKFLSAKDLLILSKKENLKISEKIKINSEKISLKNIFKGFFSKSHSKSFFFGGFIFIFTSLITPFKTYYLIFGVLFLIFSIISRFNKNTSISTI